jgi:TolB-like protein
MLAAGPLSEKEVIRLGMQLSDGLAAAHEHGVVHRDLKPGNLRLTSDRRLKILDFGLAKLRQPLAETAVTESSLQSHSISGTLPYMAPEQLSGEEVDARTDIHGAGFVLYEMATGQRPFAEVKSGQLIGALMRKAPIPPTTLNPKVSAELERIIGKCVEKDPENRYQSAKELAIDLRRLGGPSTTATAVQKMERRTLNLISAVGALSVTVCIALFALNVGGWRDRLLGKAVAPPIRSLAVLPLANLSEDPGQEYFVDGMTEELITNLSTISGLRVISRTSTMQYKGSKKPLPKIAQELNVEAVMEGSVRRVGDRVRITLQLLEAASERHLWSSSFDRNLKDILTLQSEVAQTVAREVKLSVAASVSGHVASARTVDPEAYEACLRGRYFLNKWTPDGLKQASAHFQHSIDIDSTFASAYAGLADAYIWSASARYQPASEAFPRARAAALKALELDEQLAEAHVSLAAIMYQFDWNWVGAEQEYRRAIALNPNSSEAHFGYGFYLATMGHMDEAIIEAKRALELDPLTPTTNLQLGWVLYYARRHDESIAQLTKTLDLAPDLAFAHMELGWNYAQKRMYP